MKKEYLSTINCIIRANAKTNKANPLYGNKVEDAVYDLVYNGTNWELKDKKPISSKATLHLQNIIVVLESPHIREFDSFGMGLMPLMNDGEFVKEFVDAFTKSQNLQNPSLNPQTTYLIYLINPIQYQCSLGIPTEYYRDYIFLYYWEKEYQDFETRLQNLLSKNTLAIVNLCTKGTHKQCQQLYNSSTCQFDKMGNKCDNAFMNLLGFRFNNSTNQNTTADSLQELVEKSVESVIQKMNPTTRHTTGAHPSSWHWKKINNKTKIN